MSPTDRLMLYITVGGFWTDFIYRTVRDAFR